MTHDPIVPGNLFVDLDPETRQDPEPDLPRLSDPGRIMFRYSPGMGRSNWRDRVEIVDYDAEDRVEIVDYDADASPFWLHESGFMDYAVDDIVELELDGVYVLEGVTGTGHTDYWGEYSEEWSFEFCRRASQEEIDAEALEDKK